MNNPQEVSVSRIQPSPYQTRTVNQATVDEIAQSILHNGLMHVPIARPIARGFYQLAFGHHRLAAFQKLGISTMPVIIQNLSDLQMFEMGAAENLKRRNLNPIEEAELIRRYMEEFKKNSVEAGEFFSMKDVTIRAKIRLLNLPDEQKRRLAAGEITIDMARAILATGPVKKLATHRRSKLEPRESTRGFDALSLLDGKTLPGYIEQAAIQTCEACPLYESASVEVCGQCPLPEFLKRLEVING